MTSIAVEDKVRDKVKEKCKDKRYNQKDVASEVLDLWAEGELEVDIF